MKKISTKSIQSQLILYFTIAILVPVIVISVIASKFIYNEITNRAESKSISDLNSAYEIYNHRISQIESITRLTAGRSFIINSLIEDNADTLYKELQVILQNEKLDVFTIVDNKGKVICRGRNPFSKGDYLTGDKFIKRAFETKAAVSGTDIVSPDELQKESFELAERSYMEVRQTPMSRVREDKFETNGMMLKSAVPLFDRNKNLVGVLIAGVLLNRNYDIVNKINSVVHENEVYKGQNIGTVTIFEYDMRIATNVKNEDGSYAISTLVSEEVYDAVILSGEKWIGDAFVVNSWYNAAYKPITDINDRVIGIIYVGILKQPFNDLLLSTIVIFAAIAIVTGILIFFVAVMFAKKISGPLRKLEGTAKQIADGTYNSNISIKAPREIESLSLSLNMMAKQLEREKFELENWAETLENKVNDRTEELKKINEQLFRSEKLASIGKLAAGVAHEINNPLTGVLTNSSLMLEDLEENDPRREDLQVIVNETIRCREIVKRLLDFARQTKPQRKMTDLNALIENIILLVRNQSAFRNIIIKKVLDTSIPEVMVDADQMQQVFINFILNASEAMPNGGQLVVSTSLSNSKEYIEIKFEDSGCGISEKAKRRIFDPFFTTKQQGTGLGLSISHGIIERHGGKIILDSELGKGTCFTIFMPVNYNIEGDD